MSVMTRIIGRIDDRMNPIVIKELRQAVAGRFVSSVLILFLTVQTFTLAIYLLLGGVDTGDFAAGRGVFRVMTEILLGTCLLFIPAYAALRLNGERADTHVDLLYVTTIRPRSIIAGKFLSAALLAVLIYAACLPFISLTYLLRGIDLPTIFLLLGYDFVVVCTGIMFAIFLACIPGTRVTKTLLALVGLAALIATFFGTIAMTYSVVLFGGMGLRASSTSIWLMIASTLASAGSFIGLMFVLCVAMVSPPTSNRALIVRTYLTAVWLLLGAGAAAMCTSYATHAPALSWLWTSVIIIIVAMLASASEREHYGARLRGMIPRSVLLRPFAFLFYSGAAGGLVWSSLLAAGTIGGAVLWCQWHPLYSGVDELHDNALFELLPLMMYFMAYILTAAILRRSILRWWISTNNTYALALILMALGTMVPYLLSLAMAEQPWDRLPHSYFVTVPFMVFTEGSHQAAWWFVSIWLSVVIAANVPWLIGRMLAFKPLQITPPPASEQPEPVAETVEPS